MKAEHLEALLLQANDMMCAYAVEIDGGHADALPLMVLCSRLKKLAEAYTEQYRAKAHEEAKAYGSEGATVMGYKVTAVEAGVNYKHTYPKQVAEAMAQAKALQATYEKLAKAATAPFEFVDTETGEFVYTVLPPVRTSTSTIKVEEK